MSDEKRILRARMRAERNEFAMACDIVLTPPAAFLDRLRPGMVVASHIAIGSEIDPSPLAAAARAAGCTLALPHVESRAGELRFIAWDDREALRPGPFGLRQPDPDGPDLAPDIILTPLVAFDAKLNRLGQGAGHYDRAFARYPAAWRLGVAWSIQHLDAIAPDPWDVPLHAVVTEVGMVP